MTTLIDRFRAFLDASPSPQHAAANAAEMLKDAGYARLDERAEPVDLDAGGRYYIHRNGSVIAFRLGSKPATEAGFRLLAAHTDSPNLRIKPNATHTKHGYVRLGVETYGGVLQATWADRDLGIAGQVATKDGKVHLSLDVRGRRGEFRDDVVPEVDADRRPPVLGGAVADLTGIVRAPTEQTGVGGHGAGVGTAGGQFVEDHAPPPAGPGDRPRQKRDHAGRV